MPQFSPELLAMYYGMIKNILSMNILSMNILSILNNIIMMIERFFPYEDMSKWLAYGQGK